MVQGQDQIGEEGTDKAIKEVYQIQSVIGKGTFATVRKGKHRETKERVAIKIMSKRKMSAEDVNAMQSEIEIMQQVDHPNIVKMFNVYEDEGHYCLIMELMQGGELFDYIIEKETFSERLAQQMMVPLFDAVCYCHDRGIVHRDLKPENLLLDGKDLDSAIIKISDFGLARFVTQQELATTTAGTPGYVAPEVLSREPYDQRCDYWSLGVVLFIMLSGTPPFYHEDNFELFEMIKKGKYTFDAPAWQHVSDEAKDLIKGLLVVNPNDRLTSEQISAHPWVTGDFKPQAKGLDTLNKMREWNSKRKMQLE